MPSRRGCEPTLNRAALIFECVLSESSCRQGIFEYTEGISFAGLQADSFMFGALSRMPHLRILILDGVKMDNMLSGFRLPRLAMLSWRKAAERSLPFTLETVMSAAVLDISGSNELERLPSDLQASTPHVVEYDYLYCVF